jgi:hypothetical protein
MLQLPVPVYRNYCISAWFATAFRTGRSGPGQHEPTLDLDGRQMLDRARYLRLLFMCGRAIQALTRQNSEPNWIVYVGVQILLGPKDAMDGGARAASVDRSSTR